MATNVFQPHAPTVMRAPAASNGKVANDADAERYLLERLAADDVSALDEVLARFWSPLVTYLVSILQPRDAAQDVAQETFLRLWERRQRLDAHGSLRGFLYSVARNLALSELRRIAASDRTVVAMRAEQDLSVSIEIREADVHGSLASAIRSLPHRRREILLLHVVHELSYKEIAAALGIAPQTVANQCSAALAALRQRLQLTAMV